MSDAKPKSFRAPFNLAQMGFAPRVVGALVLVATIWAVILVLL